MSDIPNSVWNETDGSNTTAAPDGAPEGMAPSGVNDVLRAHQGAVKRWYNWSVPKTTGGTSTAYTLTYGVSPTALVDGMTHVVQFNAANGALPTLNVNALGAVPLHYFSAGSWRAVPPAMWAANAIFRVAYNSSAGAYRILDLPDRTGIVEDYAGSTAPAGTLLCYAQAISRTDYPGLFAAIGTAYGAGDGSTTFNLPDGRGVTSVGRVDMGGSDRGNLSSATVLGTPLGNQSVPATVTGTATGALSVSISGTTSTPTGTDGFAGTGSGGFAPNLTHTHTFSGSGSTTGTMTVDGSTTVSTVQPSIVFNKIIRL